MISTCQGLADVRNRLLKEFRDLCKTTKNRISFDDITQNEERLCQFVLDPTSLNLPIRLSLKDPLVTEFFKLSRDFCYIVDKTRIELLKNIQAEQNKNS